MGNIDRCLPARLMAFLKVCYLLVLLCGGVVGEWIVDNMTPVLPVNCDCEVGDKHKLDIRH